jgi:hypothetical protein
MMGFHNRECQPPLTARRFVAGTYILLLGDPIESEVLRMQVSWSGWVCCFAGVQGDLMQQNDHGGRDDQKYQGPALSWLDHLFRHPTCRCLNLALNVRM